MCSAMPALGAPMSGRTSGSWTMGSMLWQAHQDESLVSASLVENWAVGGIVWCAQRTWQFSCIHHMVGQLLRALGTSGSG